MEAVITALLVGLAIFRPGPDEPAKGGLDYPGDPGTTLHVMIRQPDKFIVSVNSAGSKLLSFSDDRGTDLAKNLPKRFGRSWLGSFPKTAKDGHSCLVTIRSLGVPKADACQIILKADIALSCGTGQKSEKLENVSLKPGTTFQVGATTVKVHKAEKPTWGDEPLSVELSTSQNVGVIKTLKFLDADGQVIKSRETGSSYSGGAVLSRWYNLGKKVQTVTLDVTYFEKLESVVVPVRIRAGVGLGPPIAEGATKVQTPKAAGELYQRAVESSE